MYFLKLIIKCVAREERRRSSTLIFHSFEIHDHVNEFCGRSLTFHFVW